MYDISQVNDVTVGRDWSDGPREWLEFKGYGLAGQQMIWVANKDGKEVCRIECMDYPWWKCVLEAKEGLILEFGVRAGASIREIAKSTKRKIYGFDWWKGLPHSHGGFTKGDCISARPTDLPPNVELIDGLFSDTLEDFLKVHDDPIGFVNIDCDLFSSSLYVLHCLMGRFVVGSIIALSDMAFSPKAQRLAWHRYLLESWQHWELIGKNHPWGEVYRCTKL